MIMLSEGLGTMRRLLGKVCGIVFASEEGDALQEIDAAVRLGADLVELRLDSILNAEPSRLINHKDTPKIVTDLAGKRRAEDRVRALKKAILLHPDFVDINIDFELGIKARGELISLAKQHGVRVICSFHDYDKTPPESEILSVLSEMVEIGADIGKVAVRAESVDDCRLVMNFIFKSAEIGLPLIAISIGELGSFTRLLGPIYGAFLTYAPISPEKVSLGQIPLEEMISIYKRLNLL